MAFKKIIGSNGVLLVFNLKGTGLEIGFKYKIEKKSRMH